MAMGVKKFVDIIDSAKSVQVVAATEKLARGSSEHKISDHLSYPTVAQNLRTLLVAICESYRVSFVRIKKDALAKSIQDFEDCFTRDFRTRLSRLCQESHTAHKRQKNTDLPSETDVTAIYNYLKSERCRLFKSLKENFLEADYIELQKVTLCL